MYHVSVIYREHVITNLAVHFGINISTTDLRQFWTNYSGIFFLIFMTFF